MNKKVIKMMFANITLKDDLRPIFNGIHFEEKRCYCTNGHIVLIYNEGSKKLCNNTIDIAGKKIEGHFPNVDSVINIKENSAINIDYKQLLNACTWYLHQEDSNSEDCVIIGNNSIKIKYIMNILNVVNSANDLNSFAFMNSERSKGVPFKGKLTYGVVMPTIFENKDIDAERIEDCNIVLSFENFINKYVFNGWKKKASPTELEWLD